MIHPSSFCLHSLKCGSPPALSPSLAGSQRIGGREAADPFMTDKLWFVVCAEQPHRQAKLYRTRFNSNRRSFNRRNFKRRNFDRVVLVARIRSFLRTVTVPISALLNSRHRCKPCCRAEPLKYFGNDRANKVPWNTLPGNPCYRAN
jgi:hypothetical protein